MSSHNKINAEVLNRFNFLKKDQIISETSHIEKVTISTLPDQRYPDLVLLPESAEEVQKIVQICSEHQIPVWYVSTGKNWGYGCRSSYYNGGVTLILERMNRIYEVNEKLGYAVIEPGVTYHQLNQYLSEKGYALWTDSAGSTQSASVIGNALDKGRGLTPYADHFGSLCGFEVVLPDGEKMSTAPSETYHCHHLYRWSVGPYLDGLFAQSNFGIVVKAGIQLMAAPEEFDFFAFEYTATENDFPAFIDNLQMLVKKKGLISFPHLANDFAMLCIVDRYPKKTNTADSSTCLTTTELEDWKHKHGIKKWTFGGGMYGTRLQIKSQKQLVKKHLGKYGVIRFIGSGMKQTLWGQFFRSAVMLGARLNGKSPEFISQIFPAMKLFMGTPTDEFAKQVYFKSSLPRPTGSFNPAQDKCGFIWTGPLVPFDSDHIAKILEIAKKITVQYGFDFFVELIIENPRTIIALFGVFFDPNDAKESARARSWYEEMREQSELAGYPPYRELSTSTNQSLSGNPKLKEFLSKIKGVIDPKNVLAPGRYGIHK